MQNNSNNQVLDIPKFEISETCENGSNVVLSQIKTKKRFNFNLKRKRNFQQNVENLSPIEIFKVDKRVLVEKQFEAEMMNKPDFSQEFLDWMKNVTKYTDNKKRLEMSY